MLLMRKSYQLDLILADIQAAYGHCKRPRTGEVLDDFGDRYSSDDFRHPLDPIAIPAVSPIAIDRQAERCKPAQNLGCGVPAGALGGFRRRAKAQPVADQPVREAP